MVVAGLVLGGGAAMIREQMNTSIRRRDEVERFLGVPSLAVVPRIGAAKDSFTKPWSLTRNSARVSLPLRARPVIPMIFMGTPKEKPGLSRVQFVFVMEGDRYGEFYAE